jgi:integrase
MRKILRKWAGIQRASSHSGRRGVATNLIHNQKVPLSTVQQVLGHKNPSTTIGYDEAPEEEMGFVLGRLSDTLKLDKPD